MPQQAKSKKPIKVLRTRFEKPVDQVIADFVQCIDDDASFALQDVQGSISHVQMLSKQGIIPKKTADKLVLALQGIEQKIKNGEFTLDAALEDVHMNVETKLKEIVGEDADYLHTARSRNDQVALDIVLHTIAAAKKSSAAVRKLQKCIAKRGIACRKAVMPGYTHLQRAQPVLFAHVLASFVAALERDRARMDFAASLHSVSPLGAAALTGTSLDIDPKASAQNCGLNGAFTNSIDAVSNRDAICDYVYAAALAYVHLSQIAETLIIWSSSEFQFIKLPDEICTGSSIMPQKRNADALELVRAKSAAAAGNLSAILGILKGLPAGYNRDLQETKGILIATERSILNAFAVMQVTFNKMNANFFKMREACDKSIFATDVAEAMVKMGIPFRQAYQAVATAIKKGNFEELAKHAGVSLDPKDSVALKTSPGGTSPAAVEAYLRRVMKNAKSV